MIDKAIHTLKRKHLLLIGGSENDRRHFINEMIVKVNYEVHRFPRKMTSLYNYIDFVRKENLFDPWYTQKGKFGTNQMLDFHWDWVSESNSLVILEEFQEMEETWKLELIKLYINQIENRKKGEKKVHLMVTQEEEENLIDKLCKKIEIEEYQRRTKRQIIEGSLQIIDIT